MHTPSLRPIALCAALALTVPSLWALPSHYHVTDLGALSIGKQIAPNGKVAGVDATGFLIRPAVFVHGNPHVRPNPFPEGIVHGLDDAGVAVGEIGDPNFRHAVVWRGANPPLDIGQLLATEHSVPRPSTRTATARWTAFSGPRTSRTSFPAATAPGC
jgi:hypothetical protein